MNHPRTVTVTTPSEREVVITRTFDAPRKLVFEAWTTPTLLQRWYAPKDWTLAVCEIDLRVGGEFHFVLRRPEGKEFGQRGTYREVVRPTRIVNTEWWTDWNPGECLVTTLFEERDGVTKLTSTVLFPSQQVRDVVLNGGLAKGTTESYAKLAELLGSP